jgi:hypothetical protein
MMDVHLFNDAVDELICNLQDLLGQLNGQYQLIAEQ